MTQNFYQWINTNKIWGYMSDDEWKFSIENSEPKKEKFSALKKEKHVSKNPKLKLDFDSKPKSQSRSKYNECEEESQDESLLLSNLKYYSKYILYLMILGSVGLIVLKYLNLL